jgi:hypothetical protein
MAPVNQQARGGLDEGELARDETGSWGLAKCSAIAHSLAGNGFRATILRPISMYQVVRRYDLPARKRSRDLDRYLGRPDDHMANSSDASRRR